MLELASPVTAFVEACCELDADYAVPRGDLYEAYLGWCKEHGKVRPTDQAGFGRDLRAAFPLVGTSRPRGDGERTWHYTGIRLKSGPSGPGGPGLSL